MSALKIMDINDIKSAAGVAFNKLDPRFENAYIDQSYTIKISDNNQTVDLNDFIEHYKNLSLQ